VNVYHYGDFRGNPHEFIRKWFDLMVHVTNWGTHQLMIGVPDGVVGSDAKAFECDELEITSKGDRTIIDLRSELEESGEYETGEQWMSLLAPIREELISGDLRPLCLACLSGLPFYEDAGPVKLPPGLGALTRAQKSLAEFMRVDVDLLAAAAELSPPARPAEDRLPAFIAALPLDEKDQLLLQAARGKGSEIGRDLLRRYQSSNKPQQSIAAECSRDDLLQRAENLQTRREAAEEKAAAAKAAARGAKQRAEREKHLQALSGREPETWREIEFILDSKLQKQYASAVEKLRDLRDLAVRDDALAAFERKLELLRSEHGRKHLFIKQLKAAKIG
jgi:hypothetical protein